MIRAMGDLILLRHGQTEWSMAGKHTGRTDVALTPQGAADAAALAPMLARRQIATVFTSPASRATRTAQLAGLHAAKQDPDLWEWDYGGYEGMTTEQIRRQRPGWYLWRDGVISGDAARRAPVPAGHRNGKHPGHRTRPARHPDLERAVRGLTGYGSLGRGRVSSRIQRRKASEPATIGVATISGSS